MYPITNPKWQEANFNTKFVIAKYLVHQVLEYQEYYFNTKFVIAK